MRQGGYIGCDSRLPRHEGPGCARTPTELHNLRYPPRLANRMHTRRCTRPRRAPCAWSLGTGLWRAVSDTASGGCTVCRRLLAVVRGIYRRRGTAHDGTLERVPVVCVCLRARVPRCRPHFYRVLPIIHATVYVLALHTHAPFTHTLI